MLPLSQGKCPSFLNLTEYIFNVKGLSIDDRVGMVIINNR